MSKLVRESIKFERGGDPRKTMKVGKLERLKKKYDEEDLRYILFKASEKDIKEIDAMLIMAATQGNLEDVRFLVQQGANIHFDKDEALRISAKYGYLDVVKYLVEHGADIHADNDSPLKLAVMNGQLDVVKYLVEQGVEMYSKDTKTLQLAAQRGYSDVVDYLKPKIRNRWWEK